jgi:hypothetical protein
VTEIVPIYMLYGSGQALLSSGLPIRSPDISNASQMTEDATVLKGCKDPERLPQHRHGSLRTLEDIGRRAAPEENRALSIYRGLYRILYKSMKRPY